ncbi:hypothetical protein LT493_10075 [Streptomyces tricolor]|nr:hypothetical protein [Streptomyces tricolor]
MESGTLGIDRSPGGGARPPHRAGRRQRTGAVHAALLRLVRRTVEIVDRPAPCGGWQGAMARPAAESSPYSPAPTGPTSTTTPTIAPVTPPWPPNSSTGSDHLDTSWCAARRHRRPQRGRHRPAGAARGPLRLIGVDSTAPSIFRQFSVSRLMRGLGSSIHPRNVAYDAFDEVH